MAPLPYCEPLTATELSGDKKTTHEAALSWQIAGILSEIPQKSRKIALSHTLSRGRKSPLTRSGPLLPVAPVRLPFPYMTLSTIQPWAISMPSSACQTGPFTAGPS